MMPDTGRYVELEYELQEDHLWHLTLCEIDPKIAKDIAPAIIEYPHVIQFPSSPFHLVKQLTLALAKHKLDAGTIYEESDYDHYHIAITIKARHKSIDS